jgi:hypothetical protein
MSNVLIFIQAHDKAEILETEISALATVGELHDALEVLGINVGADSFIFVDEVEEHENKERLEPLRHVKHGSRIHVSRCKCIPTTVNFLDRSEVREFPPGTRVRSVKGWAAHVFDMDPKDSAEHVLQLCNSTDRPPTDTPLHQLIHGHNCALCFDLVPEKRVEG